MSSTNCKRKHAPEDKAISRELKLLSEHDKAIYHDLNLYSRKGIGSYLFGNGWFQCFITLSHFSTVKKSTKMTSSVVEHQDHCCIE
ncbi:hypothetical protein MTR_4g045730 [Medicago truncatula]|uniref:Uncharacterized protein n=1 Tax=Medicago truncatula TaxID=3880 RepID=A0A072UIH1_MEDTR|nr:hypothetical protein MTR_4g045713 [Medicago truncatula]KEH29568.1 hypothetical protein MTR_4g045730 [Medicago truncatula]